MAHPAPLVPDSRRKRCSHANVDGTAGKRPAFRSPHIAVPATVEFRYSQTESFVEIMRQLGASVRVSTDQPNLERTGTHDAWLVHPLSQPGKPAVCTQGGAETGAPSVTSLRIAPAQVPMMDAWPHLSEPIKATVLAFVRAAGMKEPVQAS
jgi:hypothetical protein